MLALLPPSEGKTPPSTGAPLDLDALSFPTLTAARLRVLTALERLCAGREDHAAEVLGLGPRQRGEIARNTELRTAPTAPASRVYTGVLYDNLGLATLDADAQERAERGVAIASGLWGLLRPGDPIPAYRLGGGVRLPRLGGLGPYWRTPLGTLVPELADDVVIDLRSGVYATSWSPDAGLAQRTARVRVLHERDGRRSVVSHFNKATKGRLLRSVLTAGVEPADVDELCALWRDEGWTVEATPAAQRTPWRLDVVVTEISR